MDSYRAVAKGAIEIRPFRSGQRAWFARSGRGPISGAGGFCTREEKSPRRLPGAWRMSPLGGTTPGGGCLLAAAAADRRVVHHQAAGAAVLQHAGQAVTAGLDHVAA